MSEEQDRLIRAALVHVRNAMFARRHGMPPMPALDNAEEALVRALYGDEEADGWIRDPGRAIYTGEDVE